MGDPAENSVLQRHQEEVEPPRAAAPGSLLKAEWDFYRRVVGRLLAEGREGQWLLIKDEEIVGVWDTEAEADAVRRERFLTQPVLMKQVLAREPVLRIGYNRLCRG